MMRPPGITPEARELADAAPWRLFVRRHGIYAWFLWFEAALIAASMACLAFIEVGNALVIVMVVAIIVLAKDLTDICRRAAADHRLLAASIRACDTLDDLFGGVE